MDIEKELYLTGQALGQVFGRTADVIKRWAYEANAKRIEVKGKIKYYLPDILNHFLSRYYKPEIDDERKIKIEIEKIKLEKEQFLLKKLREEAYEKAEVELAWAQRLAYVRQALLALEFHLASELANQELSQAEIREIVKKHARAILEEFSREGKFTKEPKHLPSNRKGKKGNKPAS